jgi:hypothetical protein
MPGAVLSKGDDMSDPRRLLRRLIRTFFPDYLRIVEPDSAVKMRLDRITFPAPEKTAEWTEGDPLEFGVVAEVPARRRGEVATVLVQVEEEVQTPPETARRLGLFLAGLELRYGQPVFLSVVYLRGGRAGVHLESAAISVGFGIELMRIFYTAVGLERARAEYFLERPEPLAWALAALMRPLERTPAEHLRACRERISNAPLDEESRALLIQGVEMFGEVLSASSPVPVGHLAGRVRG